MHRYKCWPIAKIEKNVSKKMKAAMLASKQRLVKCKQLCKDGCTDIVKIYAYCAYCTTQYPPVNWQTFLPEWVMKYKDIYNRYLGWNMSVPRRTFTAKTKIESVSFWKEIMNYHSLYSCANLLNKYILLFLLTTQSNTLLHKLVKSH